MGPAAVPRAHDAEADGAGARDPGGHRLQAADHGLEIAEIRGVNTSGVLNTLLERQLVKIVGRKQVVGRPFMYATTREFLIRFGLSDLTDLPKVEDMAEALGFEVPRRDCHSHPHRRRNSIWKASRLSRRSTRDRPMWGRARKIALNRTEEEKARERAATGKRGNEGTRERRAECVVCAARICGPRSSGGAPLPV